jgi:hypothetical protein
MKKNRKIEITKKAKNFQSVVNEKEKPETENLLCKLHTKKINTLNYMPSREGKKICGEGR